MRVSIVTTLYQSAPYLAEFHRRMVAAAAKISDDYEIIYVVDGSPDNSLEMALDLRSTDPRIVIVELARNFGQHKALMTGLMHSTGERVFFLDSDLEEHPEWLNLFNDEMNRQGVDVVYGIQGKRKGAWFERVTGELFWWLFNLCSSVPIPPNQVAARLMTRTYVQALVAHQERELFLCAVCAMTGFRQVGLPVTKLSKGSTSYNVRRKAEQAVNGITSFSNRPLWFIFLLGCLVASVSLLAAGVLVFRWLFLGEFLAGWPSLIVSIWLLGGLNIFALGVVGIYVSKLFTEIKQRPYTIIRQIYPAPNSQAKKAA
jgi:putative glycosyltransferase